MEGLERPYLAYVLLATAVLAALGGGVWGSFHFDDYSIFSDPVLTSSSGWWEVWEPGRTRPLTYFTFWLNHQMGGQDPAGYHALNLLIHMATVLLLYSVLSALVGRRAALVAAALFGVHPIQSEPVLYIFARATLLMTFFSVLSLGFWVKGRRWWAVAAFAVALLAKEECVALPAFLLLLHLSGARDRSELRPIAVMTVLSLVAGARVMYVLASIPDSGAGAGAVVSPLGYLAAQGVAIVRYLRLLVIPYGFTIDPEITVPTRWIAFLAWAAIGALALVAIRRFAGVRDGFWLLAGLVLLLPSSSIFPADDLAADRRMYLPMIALCAAAGLLLSKARPVAPVVAALALTVLSIGRLAAWHSEESLWREAVERSPGKLRPKIQLARAADNAEAITLLDEARKLAPESPLVASELGRRYLATGRAAEALKEFGRALALEPGNPMAHNNRGVALMGMGQRDAARADFERALELEPCQFDARHNLQQIGFPTPAPPECRFTDEQRRLLVIRR